MMCSRSVGWGGREVIALDLLVGVDRHRCVRARACGQACVGWVAARQRGVNHHLRERFGLWRKGGDRNRASTGGVPCHQRRWSRASRQ